MREIHIEENSLDKIAHDFLMKKTLKMVRFPGLFITTQKICIQENESTFLGVYEKPYDYVVPNSLERGKILDSFSKIEYFVSYLIIFKINPNVKSDMDKYHEIQSLVNRITFEAKYSILKEWCLINSELDSLFYKLKSVRNVLAHHWVINNAAYGKDKTIETNFVQFQEDIRKFWILLVEIYEKLESQEKQLQEMLEFVNKLDKTEVSK